MPYRLLNPIAPSIPGTNATTSIVSGVNRAGLDPGDFFKDATQIVRPKFEPKPAPARVEWFSFGAAEEYQRDGGHCVLADDCDIDQTLADCAPGIGGAGAAVPAALAAFSIHPCDAGRNIHVHVRFRCTRPGETIIVQADAGAGPRVLPRQLTADADGIAEADLDVTGLPLARTGIIDETWSWRCRTALDAGQGAADQFPVGSIRVRVYAVAGKPLNHCPRESFYHVACAVGGASNARDAEAAVWHNFSAFLRGGVITNAKGQELTLWESRARGNGQCSYTDRDAHDLVRLTDSSCFGWADLLCEAMEIHGIDARVKGVQPRIERIKELFDLPALPLIGKNPAEPVCSVGIMVRPFRWTPREFIRPGSMLETEWVRHGDFVWKVNDPSNPTGLPWPHMDVTDLGRPCQGTRHVPRAGLGVFANHGVVLVEDGTGQRWYDPTFGIGPSPSLVAYEEEMLGKGQEDCGGIFAIVGCRFSTPVENDTPRPIADVQGLYVAAVPAPREPVFHALDPATQKRPRLNPPGRAD